MDSAGLEERIRLLERDVADLQLAVSGTGNGHRWRQTVGMFRNDPVFREIAEAGNAIREAERAEE